jgi:predicted AAA+ superfamily ATPase
VGRWNRILDRLERVLGLAERELEARSGADPSPGLFERAVAFRWDARRGGRLRPIERPQLFDLEDLVGVERAKGRLVANTEQFLAGLPFNHVLLHGERGTGKSSAVRGLLERYAERGLRVVELHRADLLDLPDVLEILGRAGHRPARSEPKASGGGPLHGGVPQRFLVFCDDLSFDSGDPGYRELKAALEGSLAAPGENICIVATSNRRHLIQERVADNARIGLDAAGDLQVGETVDEKLALSDRFGLVIGFYAFDQDAYLAVVKHYAAKAGLEMPWEELRSDALRWALRRASRSGRCARQFVDDLAGRKALARTR